MEIMIYHHDEFRRSSVHKYHAFIGSQQPEREVCWSEADIKAMTGMSSTAHGMIYNLH